jgi:hypothetical protein
MIVLQLIANLVLESSFTIIHLLLLAMISAKLWYDDAIESIDSVAGWVDEAIVSADRQQATGAMLLLMMASNWEATVNSLDYFHSHWMSALTYAFIVDGWLWAAAGYWKTIVFYTRKTVPSIASVGIVMMIPQGRDDPTAFINDEQMAIGLALWATMIVWPIVMNYDGYVPWYGRRPDYMPKQLRGWRPVIMRGKDLAVKLQRCMQAMTALVWTAFWFPKRLFTMLHRCVQNDAWTDDDEPDGSHCFREEAEKASKIELGPSKSLFMRVVSQHDHPMARILLFLLSLKAGFAMLEDTGESWMVLQHMMFCLKSSARANLIDHRFDSDSFIIAIDNCSSRCITNNANDFVGKPTPVSIKVRGMVAR